MTKPNGWTGEQMRQMADSADWIGKDVASMLRQGANLYEALDAILPYAANMLEHDHPVVVKARAALSAAEGGV